MARLHFTDLQVLVVEYDIERVKEQLEQLKHRRNQQNGIEERPGTYTDLIPKKKK